jgi:aerobic carbon-monoxide dehydrogenase small subunit
MNLPVMNKLVVSATINGDSESFLCDPGTTLLDALRTELGLTGTKEGCGSGDCGACTIMLDGAMVCSCLVLAAEAEGKSIRTIEGVAEGGALHPVQAKFLELGALQCGFCTPGFIVAAKALLEKHPDPSETEIRYWLAGNLCRCTGYDKIVRAVIAAGAELRQERRHEHGAPPPDPVDGRGSVVDPSDSTDRGDLATIEDAARLDSAFEGEAAAAEVAGAEIKPRETE